MLERNGAPPEVVAAARKQAQPDANDFEVWADCWDAFEFFISLRGEWSYIAGMATVARIGIPSDRIESAMTLKPVPRRRRPKLYADVKLMESAVVAFDRESREKKE